MVDVRASSLAGQRPQVSMVNSTFAHDTNPLWELACQRWRRVRRTCEERSDRSSL